jgi:hypothetical protein
MPTTQQPNCFRQLRDRGYKFHVFISWPRSIRRQGLKFVKQLTEDLEDRFRDFAVKDQGVFLDEKQMDAGDVLESALRKSLCRSGITIAILVPAYFESTYCLTEWNITEQLQKARLPAASSSTCFIPLVLIKDMELPNEVKGLLYKSSFAKFLSYGQSPKKHEKWHMAIEALAKLIEQRLKLMCQTDVPVPDWPTDEALAMQLEPKVFSWPDEAPPPSTPGAGAMASPGKRELAPAVSGESKL